MQYVEHWGSMQKIEADIRPVGEKILHWNKSNNTNDELLKINKFGTKMGRTIFNKGIFKAKKNIYLLLMNLKHNRIMYRYIKNRPVIQVCSKQCLIKEYIEIRPIFTVHVDKV